MKKGLLLILGMLMMVSTAEATDGAKLNSITDYTVQLHRTQSIKFVERGVLFNISPNGAVNFDKLNKYKTQYYYRNGKRSKKFIPQKKTDAAGCRQSGNSRFCSFHRRKIIRLRAN